MFFCFLEKDFRSPPGWIVTPYSYLQFCWITLDTGKELCLSLVLFSRTLLALGCHVGISDEHAEEKVKKMKLPKK